MKEQFWNKFKGLLDDRHQWPGPFMMKFILPEHKFEDFLKLADGLNYQTRPSNSGKYLSVTINHHFESSQHVIDIYQKFSIIEGLISL